MLVVMERFSQSLLPFFPNLRVRVLSKMSSLSKSKFCKFITIIAALSSVSAIFTTAKQAEAFPAPTILSPGASIKSNNQCFSLEAQSDGNLVIYRRTDGKALWASGTDRRNVKQTVFQPDGNLVIYNTSNQPIWASGTDRRGGTQIAVQDDGNVVMYNAQNQPIWATKTVTSCRPDNALIHNTTMPPGRSISSDNKCFSLEAQSDGNLVIYRRSNGQALWNTATYGRNVKQTVFQPDGNLVIYNTSNQPIWSSGTDRRGGTQVALQDDGNFVMYNAQKQALWQTNTVTSCNAPPPPQLSNPDISIRLTFNGNFTNTQKNAIRKAAQNWENIITSDMVKDGVLNINVTEGSMSQPGNHWAETNFPYSVGQIATPRQRHTLSNRLSRS